MFICHSIKEAAIQAGYSHNYANAPIYQKFKSDRFQAKLIKAYKDNCYSDLPIVHKINRLSLRQMVKDLEQGDIDSVAKLKHIPRQILEITSLLKPEGTGAVNFVNIENLQAIVNGKFIKPTEDKG